MKVGIISDVHAQPRVLERALERMMERGVDRILCCGDVVEKGPDGDAAVALLRAWLIPCVQGNHDVNAVRYARWPVTAEPGGAPERARLRPETLAWLEALPATREYVWERRHVLVAHGSPVAIDMYLFEDDLPKRFRKYMRRADFDVLAVGHTHAPMRVWWGDRLIVNPGSVSCRKTRDSGTFGVLTLPERAFEVFAVEDGAPWPLEDVVYDG